MSEELSKGDPFGAPAPRAEEPDRHTVLEVFGVKLEVTNSRLAELLTMDAGEALTTDVRDLAGGRGHEDVDEMHPGAPEWGAAHLEHTASSACGPGIGQDVQQTDGAVLEHRREMRQAVGALGARLGFDASPDGMWISPTWIAILTRVIDRPTAYAEACRFVSELAAQRERTKERETAGLFVLEGHAGVEMFTTAIRQQRMHHLLRAIDIADLRVVADLVEQGKLDHESTLTLFVPVVSIDAGSIIRKLASNS